MIASNDSEQPVVKRDRLPLVGLVALIIYNLVFFLGKFTSGFAGEMLSPLYRGIRDSQGFFTVLELIGVAGIFVDTIVRYELLSDKRSMRNARVFLVAMLLIAFVFKLFVNYLDSAYLTVLNT